MVKWNGKILTEDFKRGFSIAFGDLRWFGLIIALTVCDQLSKLVIVREFDLHESVSIVPGFFNLVYVQNKGAAFGLFSAMTSPLREIVLFGTSALALCVVFTFLGSAIGERLLGKVALAFVCGGAIGNFIDRTRLGYVIDFLDFYAGTYHWPAFNLADSFIVLGVVTLVLLRTPHKDEVQSRDEKLDHLNAG